VSLTSRVLYRDEQLLVVDKPAGVAAAATPQGERGTLPALLARQLGLPRPPHVVHRLDRPVSGVMALALDGAGARAHTAQFESGRARKEYCALVQGAPPRDRGTIEAPIGRDPRRRGRQRVDARGAPARTDYQVRERGSVERPLSALWLRLHTGRTHQLRVHLAYLGCPILGDALYGGPQQVTTAAGTRAVTRLCLHAARLTLEAPDGSLRVFEAPVPEFLD
jgi:RluA family pseudouridine synthase